jgi:hypothetical protein
MDYPIFPSKSFIVFTITLKSFIYFKLILVHGVRKGFKFILLHVDIQFVPEPFVEKTCSSPTGWWWHPR